MFKSILFILIFCMFNLPIYALDEITEIDLSSHFKDFRESTFVIYDMNNKVYKIHNTKLADKRRSPCSTFKILNSLIGLETGVLKNKDHLFKWDGTKRWNEDWNRDHTLESAFKNSVVWYYQDLARQVGSEKMQEYVDKMDYGNKDISGGIVQFWLGDSLEISAMEQIRFLTKFVTNHLPFSQKNIDTVKEMMIYQNGYGYTLRGKTGSGFVENETSWGWYVGYIEHRNNVYVFASNIEAKEGANGRKLRGIVLNILKEMKLMQE